MKKSIRPFLSGFITTAILLLNACAPAYIPNTVNTPMLSNKGELQASVNSGISGFDPQLSYAITDHIGVMLNGSFSDRTSDSTDDYHKHQFVELGSGYYTKIGTIGRYETFAGFGLGNTRGEYSTTLWSSYADAQFFRIFIQPSIGLATSFFDGGFAWRFVIISMTQEQNKSTGFFFEPVITLKLGYKYVKMVTQFGLSLPVTEEIAFNYQPFMFSVGLHAYLWRKFD